MIDQITKNIHFVFLAYALFLGYDHYLALEQQITTINAESQTMKIRLRKKNKELTDVKRFESNLQQSKDRVASVVKQIENIQRQLPSDIRDTEVSGTLTDFSKELKMLSPSPTPKEEINHKFYISKNYSFDVRGTYLQFLIFFERLENLSKTGRILNVKSLSMKVNDDADKRSRFQILNLSTIVEAYKYNDKFKVKDL